MTISTPRTEPRPRAAGFTMVEVLISATIGSFLLLAVLTTSLFLGRSGANLANYSVMETQARGGLERFAQDVRMAKNCTWNDTTRVQAGYSITLTLPPVTSGGADTQVTYYYDSTALSFCTKSGAATSTATPTVLITGVQTFGFDRYKIGTLGAATNDLETKQIQLTLTATRTSITAVTASNMVLSARFIMRNKVSST